MLGVHSAGVSRADLSVRPGGPGRPGGSIQQAHHLTQDEALEFIRKGDKRRAAYHNEHCPTQWGHGDTYDLTINSSRLGLSGTTDFLEDYIRRRIAAEP